MKNSPPFRGLRRNYAPHTNSLSINYKSPIFKNLANEWPTCIPWSHVWPETVINCLSNTSGGIDRKINSFVITHLVYKNIRFITLVEWILKKKNHFSFSISVSRAEKKRSTRHVMSHSQKSDWIICVFSFFALLLFGS